MPVSHQNQTIWQVKTKNHSTVTSDEFLTIFSDLSMVFWPLENLTLILIIFEKDLEFNFDEFFSSSLLKFWLISTIFRYAWYLMKKLIFVVSQSEKEIVNQDKWWKYLEEHWYLTFYLNSLIQFFIKSFCYCPTYLLLRIWSQRDPVCVSVLVSWHYRNTRPSNG